MQPECEIVAQQQNSPMGLCPGRNSAAGSKRGWRSVKIRPGFPDRFPLPSLPEIFSPDGPLARAIGGYRVRQQQVEMAERIAAAIQNNSVFIAEAGTGTGKTFAYLVPAIFLNYYPALWILDKPDPFRMPAFAHYVAPLVGAGLLGGLAHIAATEAVARAPVSVLAPFDFTGLIWAVICSASTITGSTICFSCITKVSQSTTRNVVS